MATYLQLPRYHDRLSVHPPGTVTADPVIIPLKFNTQWLMMGLFLAARLGTRPTEDTYVSDHGLLMYEVKTNDQIMMAQAEVAFLWLIETLVMHWKLLRC